MACKKGLIFQSHNKVWVGAFQYEQWWKLIFFSILALKLFLRYIVRKTKYYTPLCDMVQGPEGAVTAVTSPTHQTSGVMAYLPYLWSQVYSLTSSKKAILDPHHQENEIAKTSTNRNGGKKQDRIFKIPPCPISHCFLVIPISYFYCLMYTSSSSMDTHSIGFGKIWNRFYINK